MSPKVATVIIIVLAIIIVILAWLLWITPASAPTISVPVSTTSPATSSPAPTLATSTAPLDESVSVISPAQNARVPQTFTVSGKAPGAWFFEATFPIQVRDGNDNIVGRIGASAQGDWESSGLVPFTATMNVDATFHGPATLILMKDNPSGLPQNDDSVTIPITIQ